MIRYVVMIALAAFAFGCNSDSGDGNEAPTSPATAETAHFLVHVDGQSLGGDTQPLENVSVYLTEFVDPGADHQPTFGHEAPAGSPVGTTNASGNANVTIEPSKKFVARFVSEGFDDLYRIVEQAKDTERHMWLTMTEAQRKTVMIPSTGMVEVTLGDTSGGSASPVTLIIEPTDLALENGKGDAAAGEIEVTYRSWDPAVDSPSSLPSDLLTADERLTSFGMFRVEFFQGDTRLNVADGQTIGWKMQVHESLQGKAIAAANDSALNIYSLDTSTGLWIEDTDVTKSLDMATGIMTTEATHFSTKNLDYPGPYSGRHCLEVRVRDQNGADIGASISIQGGGGQIGCTQYACDFNNRQGDAVNTDVTARRHIVGDRWQTQTINAQGRCDDESGGVGCGLGGCAQADFTFNLCHERMEPCQDRGDCCEGLGCFNGVCDTCTQAAQECSDDNQCCGGLDCTDAQCFAP